MAPNSPADNNPPPYVALLNMIIGNWISGAIAAAARLKIADYVGEAPTSTTEIATKAGAHEPSLFRLMRGLASVGIFAEQSPRKFVHTPLSQFLRTDHPNSMRDVADMLGSDFAYRPWEQLHASVLTGKPAFELMYGTDHWSYFKAHPDANDLFNRAMTGIAASMHHAAMEAYDFSRFESLIDVGGGHGHLLASILKANPSMRGSVYDQAHVIGGAAPMYKSLGVSDRAGAMAGSFFESIPAHPGNVAPGKSAYIMSHILHDWNDEQCLTILTLARAAAKPGTTLLVFDAVIPPGNNPDFGKLMDLNMMALITGRERTADEFRELLGKTGFRVTRIVPTKSSVSIVESVAV
jgi:hypothetical protein